MKSSLALPAGCVLLALAAAAAAQDNRIGLYQDAAATVNAVQSGAGQLTLYMVALNPVGDGGLLDSIRGFEAKVAFDALADFVLDARFPVNVINVGTVGNFIVGYGEPLPLSGNAAVIATVVVYTAGGPESNIYLVPSDPPSTPGYLALLDGGFNVVAMEPSSGDVNEPVFYVNAAGPAQEINSWGATKSLFR